MAPKRLLCSGTDPYLPQNDPPDKKRPRQTFASIIGEAVMANALKQLSKALEPLLRQVVNEEVNRSLMRHIRTFTRESNLTIQPLEPSTIQLYFVNKLPSRTFTGTKITDVESQSLRIAIEDGGGNLASSLSPSVKIEIVVLDGGFPAGGKDDWTEDEFNANIVNPRCGKRPLLCGDLNSTLRHGSATVGDIEFTDNSSWVRSRTFRLGARIVNGSDRDKGPRVREAITDPFMVKDHRGELYKKHYPPMLHDEVWRLEKIAKGGVFHKKLSIHNINTVQEFLRLLVVDPQNLKEVLGVGMSEKMWKATVKHAQTCELGNKLYMYRGHSFMLFLNPICEVVRAIIGEHIYSSRDLHNIPQEYLKSLRRQAFDNWHAIQDLEENLRENLLLTQGDEGVGNEESDYIMEKSLFQSGSSCKIIGGEIECRESDSNADQIISQRNFHNNYG